MKCPVCKGKGLITVSKSDSVVDVRRKAAKALRASGLTMREIQQVLGYKSVSTIDFLLK